MSYFTTGFISGLSKTVKIIIKSIVTIPEILDYLSGIQKSGPPVNDWERIHYTVLLEKGCGFLSLISVHSNNTDPLLGEPKMNLCSNLLGKYIEIDLLLMQPEIDREKLEKLLQNVTQYMEQAITKEQYSRLDYLPSVYLLQQHQYSEVRQYFEGSINKWSYPANPASDTLANIIGKHNNI